MRHAFRSRLQCKHWVVSGGISCGEKQAPNGLDTKRARGAKRLRLDRSRKRLPAYVVKSTPAVHGGSRGCARSKLSVHARSRALCSHPKPTSTPAGAPIVVPCITLNTAALAVALAAAQLTTGGRLKRGAPLGDGRRYTSLLLTTLLTSLHVPPMWPSPPPSSLPLLIFLHSVLFINAYAFGSCCAASDD